VGRLVRSNLAYENISISIFVLFCPLSKIAGTQYTKRMLPPFVIPECNISLENSMQLLEQFPEKPIDYDRACQILGTCHEATVKRHYRLMNEMMQVGSNLLMTWLADHPLLSIMPTTTPAITLFNFFMDTYEALISAWEKLSGYSDTPPKVIIVLSIFLMIKKVRKPLPIPFNLNCLIRFLFDTS
jgi:hypothetical protein